MRKWSIVLGMSFLATCAYAVEIPTNSASGVTGAVAAAEVATTNDVEQLARELQELYKQREKIGAAIRKAPDRMDEARLSILATNRELKALAKDIEVKQISLKEKLEGDPAYKKAVQAREDLLTEFRANDGKIRELQDTLRKTNMECRPNYGKAHQLRMEKLRMMGTNVPVTVSNATPVIVTGKGSDRGEATNALPSAVKERSAP